MIVYFTHTHTHTHTLITDSFITYITFLQTLLGFIERLYHSWGRNCVAFICRSSSTYTDGAVFAYIPAVNNEGQELYHMIHDDNDCEDIDFAEMLRGVTSFECNRQEPEEGEEAAYTTARPSRRSLLH